MITTMTRGFFKKLSFITLVGLLISPISAWALSLDAAKDQGLVGELTSGYLGHVTTNPSSDVTNLIDSINKKRKAAYQKKAKEAGVSLMIMEQSVGKRLIERAEKGHYVSTGQGSWQKK